ncbi:MAG: acyl-ACP--UDP-N-acetylglucosamine O-acyltransferase [Gemmatimonadota bacterium]
MRAELEVDIHPTALVDPSAELDVGVQVGAYSIVGPNVEIGARTSIASHVLVERDTVLGSECSLHHGAVLGSDPQDLKYKAEPTRLIVGDRTVVREFATLNRGTAHSSETRVGSDCLLMAYTHVAHDCRLGNHVILANAVQMAGHVTIEDWVIVGGGCVIHQFVRIGAHAFIGGGSRVPQDVPPYCRSAGNDPKLYGLNSVGLQRRGFAEPTRAALKKAYRILFHSALNVSQGLARIEEEIPGIPEVDHLVAFIRASERGITIG